MKYIVLQIKTGGVKREVPILFPDLLTHADVVEGVGVLCPELRLAKPVAAGFLSSMFCASGVDGSCYGYSETLKLKSRGKVDDLLINMYDYQHGIVS